MVEKLGDLRVYRSTMNLSDMAWDIYCQLPKEFRYGMGTQFIRSVDSIGANIAEGFGRYHYKDKIKFYYNARGSLWEAKHWLYLLHKRDFINKKQFNLSMNLIHQIGKQLNNFIKATGENDG